MSQALAIIQLLNSPSAYPKALELLKKIILTTQLGRLRINGQAPDNKIPLAEYLFDNERILFDYSRLSSEKKIQFKHWLVGPYQSVKKKKYWDQVSMNEYRGFAAEKKLGWWGSVTNWLGNNSSDRWKLHKRNKANPYQPHELNMHHNRIGTLVGFKQTVIPNSGTKYKDPTEKQHGSMNNTKRIYLTDHLVNRLINTSLEDIDFNDLCKSAHPQSIEVLDATKRFRMMKDYRAANKFVNHKSWFQRLIAWIVSWFKHKKKPEPVVSQPDEPKPILHTDKVSIYQRSHSKELIVTEKKPNFEFMVYCGGGPRIFGHVGVWKALNENNLRPTKFAGTSSGAIMSLFCYLGYNADQIVDLLKNFKKHHLFKFEMNAKGISDSSSLKTALDYVVTKRIVEVVNHYKIPYPKGTITFATLAAIQKQCPGCGFGDELVITATNIRQRSISYFSLARTPHIEVTKAVTASASVPVIFRPTRIEGAYHSDGAVLDNFPTEIHLDGHSTLVESEYGNNLKVLGVQFNFGTERNTIDKVMSKVHKENFIVNWFYRLVTGVNNPASAWVQDRIKLRKYAAQTIVVDIKSSTISLEVSEATRNQMITKGYKAALDYLAIRYVKNDQGKYTNDECMYSHFSSFDDLLAYCCHRGNKEWFETILDLIVQTPSEELPHKSVLIKHSMRLRQLYFNKDVLPVATKSKTTFFANNVVQLKADKHQHSHPELFVTVYPILIGLTHDFMRHKSDRRMFDRARRAVKPESPLNCLKHLNKIDGSIHVLLRIIIDSLNDLNVPPNTNLNETFEMIKVTLLKAPYLKRSDFFGKWVLTPQQRKHILKLISSDQIDLAVVVCRQINQGAEPLIRVDGNKSQPVTENNDEKSAGCLL